MGEKGWQVVVELTVYELEVVLKVGSEVVYVIKDLLEVLLNDGQYARQLDVTQARNNVISDSVVLVSNQDGEFDIKTLHHFSRLTLHL